MGNPDLQLPAKKPTITRRTLLKRARLTILGVGAATLGYAWRIEPHWIEVVRRPLPIAKLPQSLIGKTLVQISDLHVGPVVDEAYISGAMAKASSLNADIMAITGDFMSCHGPEQIEPAMRVLKHLQPGKLATVGILGNHDYASNWSNAAVADKLTHRLTDIGVTVLRNDKCDVMGLQIAGIDDYWGPNFNPRKAMAMLDRDRASLTLCHNPDAMDEPQWDGYRGWVLAGHTHGGQCKPPFLNPPVIPVRNKRYTAGEFALHNGRRLYINRGLGYLIRARFNARPEITFFTLTSA